MIWQLLTIFGVYIAVCGVLIYYAEHIDRFAEIAGEAIIKRLFDTDPETDS